jgi:LPS-assembly protein
LEAERVEYDSKKNIMTAKGNVEVFRNNYLLKADSVLYDKLNDKASAHGNVVLVKPNGEELYAESIELSKHFTEILAFELKARLSDNNIFTAKKANSSPDRMIFDKATYSPCEICEKHKPQWQIRSSKIEYVKKKDTSFVNSFFDVYGITSFYLPYMKVASHDAEPKSGFLFPSYYKYREIYGHGLSIPYYLRISENNDFLYSPIITTQKKILHSGKYRFMLQKEHTNNIAFEYIRSKQYTNPAPCKDRYYVKANLAHRFDKGFVMNSEINRVSDKSYLKNYRDENVNYLRSFVDLDYLTDTSRFKGESHQFQELRVGDTRHNTDITVAPRFKYDKTFIANNSRFNISSEVLNMLKKTGGNTSKLNLEGVWDNNYAFGNHKIETSKIIHFDSYKFANIKTQPSLAYKKSYNFSRITPEVSLAWKYPFMLANNWHLTYMEPIVKFIASPPNVHNKNIFNEDSQEIELSDSNLFNNNRYTGSDRLEEGGRINYGIVGTGQAASYQYPKYDFVFGQSYRAKKGGDYSINSGLQDRKFSDYVGRISLKTSHITDFHYLFQIDQESHVFRKNEVSSVFNFDIERNQLNKLLIDAKLSSYNYKQNDAGIQKSISLGGTLYFLKEWHVGMNIVKNIYKNEKVRPIQSNFSLGYNGQCTNIILSAINNNTSDDKRGIKKGGFAYNIEIHLKNIN